MLAIADSGPAIGAAHRGETTTTGEITTYTVISVPDPRSPYVAAIADVGPVTLTGQVRSVAPEAVEVGQGVALAVEPTDDEHGIVFTPP